MEKIYWYPPAETRIPWPAIYSAFCKRDANFSKKLCKYLNVEHCLLGESGRALLFKLLEALKKKNKGKRNVVLIPGYTCYSVAAAIAKANLKIAAYDLDPKTFKPDMNSIHQIISENVLAVITQHLFGIQSPVEEIKKTSEHYGAFLIEDAAQAFGTIEKGAKPGTLGDFGLFSFGRGKPLPVGCGGALVSRGNSDILHSIRLPKPEKRYRQAAILAAIQYISRPALYWIPEMLPFRLGQTVFNPGFNVRGMPFAVESMLIKAMPILDKLNNHRMKVSNIYMAYLPDRCQIKGTKDSASIIRFPVMLPNSKLKKELKRLGIRRMYPHAIYDEDIIKIFLYKNQKPTYGASEIANKLFTLPTHLGISNLIAEKISDKIHETIRKN